MQYTYFNQRKSLLLYVYIYIYIHYTTIQYYIYIHNIYCNTVMLCKEPLHGMKINVSKTLKCAS